MHARRIVRSIVLAVSLATLTALSWASTIMAVTGGGDFPVRR